MADLKSNYQISELFAALARTATVNGASVDLQGLTGPITLLLSIGAVAGTTPTLDVKLQDSDDNVSFADIAGSAFPQKTAGAFDSRQVNLWRRFVRAVATIGGTGPSFTFSLVVLVEKQYK